MTTKHQELFIDKSVTVELDAIEVQLTQKELPESSRKSLQTRLQALHASIEQLRSDAKFEDK
jgi:hypothetical protein